MQLNRSLCALLLLTVTVASADVFRIDSPAKWRRWKIPEGIVTLNDAGGLELVKFRRAINAVADAPIFTHPTQQRGDVQGGIWRAGSNAPAADRIIDGDRESFWQPDPDDQLIKWSVDIDLGRPVLAREIVLHFPARDGANPFLQFSVFTSTGSRIQAQDDVFRYRKVFQTTKPNLLTEVRVPLLGSDLDTTRVIDGYFDIDLGREQHFQMVRMVRVVIDELQADAALGEVEVFAAGDNLSLGVLERGGSFVHGLLARDPQNMFDGNMDSFAVIVTSGGTKGGWREGGMWWQVDLGALFWVDELFMYFQTRGEALSSFLFEGLHHGRGFDLLFSDGRRTTGGELDFELLFREEIAIDSPLAQARRIRHMRYLFEARKIRYLFWHGHEDNGWFSKPMEFMIFSPGYPAQVVLRSDFIDLGQVSGDGRPKAIKGLSWEAGLPPATNLQLRSRSGNALDEVYTFHDRTGAVVTETKWNSSPKVLRGEVDTALVAGQDWGPWSNFYQLSGEAFKSDTPRRFIQLELILSTENPAVAPDVGSLTIEFEDALVQGAKGQILPRQAAPNENTRFHYTIWPSGDSEDSGFNRVRLDVSQAIADDQVELIVAGGSIEPAGVSAADGHLIVDLPAEVRDDSVTVAFTARLLRNATVFDVVLGHIDRPGLWQSVEARSRRDNIVFLPQLAGDDRLIGDLQISPQTFTPNGDGVNDEVEVRFALYKVDAAAPRVRVFDLLGREVAGFTPAASGALQYFRWDGRDPSGNIVPPGIYLCQIDAMAEAGAGEVLQTISVAY